MTDTDAADTPARHPGSRKSLSEALKPIDSLLTPRRGSSVRPVLRSDSEKEAEAFDLKKQIATLEYEIASIKDEKDLQKIFYEQSLADLQRKLTQEGQKVESLEADQSFLYEKNQAYEKEISALKAEMAAQKTGSEAAVRELRQKYAEAKDMLFDVKDELQRTVLSAGKKQQALQLERDAAQNAAGELQKQAETLAAELAEKRHDLLAKDELVAELRQQHINSKAGNGNSEAQADVALLTKELKAQLRHIEQLEEQTRQQSLQLDELRGRHESVEVLKEEIRHLEKQAASVALLRKQVAQYEVELAEYREKDRKWAEVLSKDSQSSPPTPEAVLQALAAERLEKALLVEKLGRIEADSASSLKGLEEIEKEYGKAVSERDEILEKYSKEVNLRNKLERQRALALKETQFLRAQLKRFDIEDEEEARLAGESGNQSGSQSGSGELNEVYKRRTEELEKIVDEYKNEVESLLRQLAEKDGLNMQGAGNVGADTRKRRKRISDTVDSEYSRLAEMRRELKKTETEKEKLLVEATTLRNELAILEDKLKRVRADSGNSPRVLQLQDNPAARDQAVKREYLEQLRKENNDLLARLSGDSDGKENVGSSSSSKMIPKSVLDRFRLEMKQTEEKLHEKEKRIIRLREIFSAKSLEFREAVYSLLGYQLDFLANSKVRVKSKYATSDSQSFIFDPDAKTMKMAGKHGNPDADCSGVEFTMSSENEAGFIKECENLIAFWVKERREIPGFLSALNLELYERSNR